MDAEEERKLCREITELEFKINELKAQIAVAIKCTEVRFDRFFRKNCTYVR